MPFEDMILKESIDNAVEMLSVMTQEARGGRKEKITVIIGAGFSQTVGIPDGLDLRDKLYDHWRLLIKETNRYLFKLYRNKFSRNSEDEIKRIGINSYDLSYRPDGSPRDPNITFEMVCSVITGCLGVEKDQVEDFLKNQIKGKKIPFGYEILAHLVGIQLIDDVVSLNFDTLFEKSLYEEIGKDRYSLIVSDEEFMNALSRGYRSPSVIKPHGSLDKKGSILFTTEDVLEFDQDKDNLLARKLSNSSIIIIGCSCSSPDVQKLLQKVALRDYTHNIFWIMREQDKDDSRNIGDFGDNLKLIFAKENSKNKLNEMTHAFANGINRDGIAGFDLIKLGRHEIRNFFWGKGGIQEKFEAPSLSETLNNKLLLEIIIFSVKIKKDFTEEDLLACPRIVNFIELLVIFKGTVEKYYFQTIDLTKLFENETIKTYTQDTNRVFFNTNIKNEAGLLDNLQGYKEKEKEVIVNLWLQRLDISPRKLLDRLISKNFLVDKYFFGKKTYRLKEEVFKQLGDVDLKYIDKESKLEKGNTILSSFAEIFGFKLDKIPLSPENMEDCKKELYCHFHELVENYDVDLANEKLKYEILLSYHEAEILETKAQANQLMGKWLPKAKEIKGVTKDGRWIIRDFEEDVSSKSNITLLLVESTLEERLIKLNDNVAIKLLNKRSKYDLHKKRFTIIETFVNGHEKMYRKWSRKMYN